MQDHRRTQVTVARASRLTDFVALKFLLFLAAVIVVGAMLVSHQLVAWPHHVPAGFIALIGLAGLAGTIGRG